MDVLFTLIPLSVALVFAVIAILCWAVFSGQFDDVEAEAGRILEDDEGPLRGDRTPPGGIRGAIAAAPPALDVDQ
jgi:cbb3-type cytochrome oxidase maturation protein